MENKIGNLQKAGHILKFFSNLKNLSMNGKKWVFEPIENSSHTTKRYNLRKDLLILLFLYVQMLKMVISTQTYNHTLAEKKVLQLKKVNSLKNWAEV